MYHILFIYFSINRHFDCFHVLAVVHSAVVNPRVNAPFRITVSFLCVFAQK